MLHAWAACKLCTSRIFQAGRAQVRDSNLCFTCAREITHEEYGAHGVSLDAAVAEAAAGELVLRAHASAAPALAAVCSCCACTRRVEHAKQRHLACVTAARAIGEHAHERSHVARSRVAHFCVAKNMMRRGLPTLGHEEQRGTRSLSGQIVHTRGAVRVGICMSWRHAKAVAANRPTID